MERSLAKIRMAYVVDLDGSLLTPVSNFAPEILASKRCISILVEASTKFAYSPLGMDAKKRESKVAMDSKMAVSLRTMIRILRNGLKRSRNCFLGVSAFVLREMATILGGIRARREKGDLID